MQESELDYYSSDDLSSLTFKREEHGVVSFLLDRDGLRNPVAATFVILRLANAVATLTQRVLDLENARTLDEYNRRKGV